MDKKRIKKVAKLVSSLEKLWLELDKHKNEAVMEAINEIIVSTSASIKEVKKQL